MKRLLALILTWLLIGLALDRFAFDSGTLAMQQPGSLSGTVRDEQGKALPGVTETLSSGNSPERVAVTNADGTFQFRDLRPGDYTVRAGLEGFTLIEQEVTVRLDREAKLELSLRSSAGEELRLSQARPIITGVGEFQRLPNGTGIAGAMFKSNVPVNRVRLGLPDGPRFDIRLSYFPEAWTEKRNPYDIEFSGPPLVEIEARFLTTEDSIRQFGEFFKKPVEFEFFLGKLNYGSYKFDFKATEPVKPVTSEQAADIPEVIRPGSNFSIMPKEAYRDGKWKLSIGDQSFEAYPADAFAGIDSASLAKVIHDKEKAKQKAYNQVQRFIDDLRAKGFLRNFTDQQNSRVFHIPKGVAPGKISITYTNKMGETTVLGGTNTKFLDEFTTASLAAPRLIRCTPKVLQNRALCICGFFPNLFSRKQLMLDGKRLTVTPAGSTDMLVFTPQNLAPGRHVITWDTAGFENILNPEPQRMKPSAAEQIEFDVLVVEGSIDQAELLAKQATKMRMRIIGTDEKVPIELENTTPNVIKLDPSDKQVAVTSGGSNNTLERKVEAKKTGVPVANFNINFRLTLPPCPCNAGETERAQKLGGSVTRPPADPPDAQPNQPRKDCELILSEYNALSIEYGKLQTDQKRVVERCDRLDDGTITGRDNRDSCLRTMFFFNARGIQRAQRLREQMLELLAAYRECIGGN